MYNGNLVNDGICHAFVHQNYSSAECAYDGGDCLCLINDDDDLYCLKGEVNHQSEGCDCIDNIRLKKQKS